MTSFAVLDVCCGSRMFWFDRNNSGALFLDKRREVVFANDCSVKNGEREIRVEPGIIADFAWREMLRAGFLECFRVLKPDGTLVFKWNEIEVPLREILALAPTPPLYGHRSGKRMNTHWCAFLKPND